MGNPAEEYSEEQRAVGSPELQRAIDAVWRLILTEGR
jgi:hypothetical protein